MDLKAKSFQLKFFVKLLTDLTALKTGTVGFTQSAVVHELVKNK